MSEPECRSCRFYDGTRGECRMNSPIIVNNNNDNWPAKTVFPKISLHDWCGEYQQGEYREPKKTEVKCRPKFD